MWLLGEAFKPCQVHHLLWRKKKKTNWGHGLGRSDDAVMRAYDINVRCIIFSSSLYHFLLIYFRSFFFFLVENSQRLNVAGWMPLLPSWSGAFIPAHSSWPPSLSLYRECFVFMREVDLSRWGPVPILKDVMFFFLRFSLSFSLFCFLVCLRSCLCRFQGQIILCNHEMSLQKGPHARLAYCSCQLAIPHGWTILRVHDVP